MPPTYYTFECSCCLDLYESALKRRHPPTPLRRRCDECIRICGHHGGNEPECRRRAAARVDSEQVARTRRRMVAHRVRGRSQAIESVPYPRLAEIVIRALARHYREQAERAQQEARAS